MSVQRKHRLPLALGAAGPVIFIACYLANGAAQPGYSSWHDTISVLSLARQGWIQIANFMLYGVLTLCFAEGLRRSGAVRGWGLRLLVIAGLGLLVIGPFRTNPVMGFPAGEASVTTATGTVHSLTSLVVFLAFPAAALVTMRRPLGGWAAFSIIAAVLSLLSVAAFFALVTAAHNQSGGDSPALFERLPTVLIGLWQIAFVTRAWTGRPLSAGGKLPGRAAPGGHLSPADLDRAMGEEKAR